MPTTVQFRRGTTAQNNAFTGAVGEITVDTTDDRLVVHDGTNAGGSRAALASETIFKVSGDDSVGLYLQGGTDVLQISGGNGISTSTASTGVLTIAMDGDITTVNSISSEDSTGIVINDNLIIAGTIKSDDSTALQIDEAVNISGALFANGAFSTNSTVTSGAITSSSSITSGSSFIIGSADINETDLEKIDGITNGTAAANKALVVDGSKDIGTLGTITAATGDFQTIKINEISSDDSTGIQIADAVNISGALFANGAFTTNSTITSGTITSGAITSSGSVTSGGSFIIGSADITETDLEKLDGITNGTVAASKAVVADSNKDIAGFRNVTATGSFIIGSADMNETDLEKIDGITNGTAAANKALVADGDIDIDTIRNLGMTGNIEVGGDAQIGGNLTVSGTTTSVNTTSLEVADALIELNKTNSGGADVDAGIFIQRGSAGNAAVFYWNEGDDKFKAVLSDSVATATSVTDSSQATIVASLEGTSVTGTTVIGGTTTINAATITNSTGAISFDNENLVTTGTIGGGTITGTAFTLTSGFTATQSSGDVTVANSTSDKDLIFTVNDGGAATEVFRLDGDVSALKIAASKQLQLGAAEESISGDGTDITFAVGSGGDINIPASIGLTFGDDAEKIEGDGTDLTITGNNINLSPTADVNIPASKGLTFATTEKIESDGTDLTITVGSGGDINIPASIGITFGDDGEKIEGDGTDLTITGNNINLSPTADVNIPASKGLTFATAEKIESDGTDLNITVGANGDINIPANIGLTFGNDGEKIEGDGTDLTIAGNNINLSAAAAVVVPSGIPIQFVDANEKIASDGTDLTIDSGAKINLSATTDVHLPTSVGLVFGAGEKIEGDDTNLTITSGGTVIASCTSLVTTVLDVNIIQSTDSAEILINEALRVSGTITGTVTQAQYADLAEIFPTDETNLEPGDVVHFTGNKKVGKCNEDAHASVAGVISTEPGFLLNEGAVGVKLAMTGRVPCKVTGTINPGDLLVSAGNGRARAEANPSIGTVIGKALESKDTAGNDVIDIMITMM